MNRKELSRNTRTINSALWGAWADALGFISEITSPSGLRERTNGRELRQPMEWDRRIGGKFGVKVTLPAGCYSDDTQLRLATSRAIGSSGFDVEAFAKVELPVWTNYALGGGIGTKAAAVNLAKPSVAWYSNFYDGWLNGGGNGAAMRVQPHVWSATSLSNIESYAVDVLVNSIVTHGHPRAIVGAILNAVALAWALENESVPSPSNWQELLGLTRSATDLFESRSELSIYWIPQWEAQSGRIFEQEYLAAVDECEDLLRIGSQFVHELSKIGSSGEPAPNQLYGDFVRASGLGVRETRGSATKTVVAALALAAAFPADPGMAAIMAANNTDTDTDTIATMAASIVGAAVYVEPKGDILDRQYIISDAKRLAEIGLGREVENFSYPDLLHWSPPQAQIDAVGLAEGNLVLAGLGWLRPMGGQAEPIVGRNASWQWTQSDFGPSFLVKMRKSVGDIPVANWPVRRNYIVGADERPRGRTGNEPALESIEVQLSFDGHADADAKSEKSVRRPTVDVDEMIRWVVKRRLSDESIGYAVRRLAEIGTIEQLVAFSVAIRGRIDRHEPEN